MNSKNYYKILGLKDYASISDIKKAYRSLALKYHPDQNKGGKSGADLFIEIKEAYDILTDPEKRRTFDTGLRQKNFYAPSYPFSRNVYPEPASEQDEKRNTDDNKDRQNIWKQFLKPLILILITLCLMYLIIKTPGWLNPK
jgi:DnaJ-class molecular chaperone